MLYLAVALFAGYLGYLICEKRDAVKNRASFTHVIHVNGIRGKTGTCRLIDAGLRAAGLRVFTKTTGNLPFYIDTAGVEHPIKRHAPANIKEQIGMMRRAAREGAEVLILECMAVNPELQRVCERAILKSSIGVITNVRYDHVLEMGGSLEAIAASLSGTIPEGGRLFTADVDFAHLFEAEAASRGTTVTLCRPDEGERDPLMENVAIAAAVCEAVTGTRPGSHVLTGGEQRDFGALDSYTLMSKAGEPITLLGLFAVNDPTSALNALAANLPEGARVIYLFNNRADRPDRTELFADRFFPEAPPGTIRVVGQARSLARRILIKRGFADVATFADWREALEAPAGSVLVGVGNIKGPGVDIIRMVEGEGP